MKIKNNTQLSDLCNLPFLFKLKYCIILNINFIDFWHVLPTNHNGECLMMRSQIFFDFY